MRLFVSVLASAAMIFAASTASAVVTFTAATTVDSGNALDALVVGDTVTIDITLRADGTPVNALGASAHLYDPGVIAFQGGQALNGVLSAICLGDGTGGCIGGLNNELVNGARPGEGDRQVGPLEESLANTLGAEIQLVNGVSTSGTSNTGENDAGVVSGVAGDAQFQIVFLAVAGGSTSIQIGGNQDFGDGVLNGTAVGIINNAVVDLTVIPEPGTALLMGLGLAGLAGAGRRE